MLFHQVSKKARPAEGDQCQSRQRAAQRPKYNVTSDGAQQPQGNEADRSAG